MYIIIFKFIDELSFKFFVIQIHILFFFIVNNLKKMYTINFYQPFFVKYNFLCPFCLFYFLFYLEIESFNNLKKGID